MNRVELTHLDDTRNHSESHNKRNKDKHQMNHVELTHLMIQETTQKLTTNRIKINIR